MNSRKICHVKLSYIIATQQKLGSVCVCVCVCVLCVCVWGGGGEGGGGEGWSLLTWLRYGAGRLQLLNPPPTLPLFPPFYHDESIVWMYFLLEYFTEAN